MKKETTMIDYSWIKEMLKEQNIDDRLLVNDVKKVYERMLEAARKGKQNNEDGIVHYGEIMKIAGLRIEDPHDRHTVLGTMLGAMSVHERACDRPLLSAVVVLKGDVRIPAGGFYRLFNDTDMSDDEFWIKTINDVWDYWSNT